MLTIQGLQSSNRAFMPHPTLQSPCTGILAPDSPIQQDEVRFGFWKLAKKQEPTFEEAIAALKSPKGSQIQVVDYFTHQGWGHRAEISGQNRDGSYRMNGHGPAGVDLLFANVRPLREGDYIILATRTADGQRFAALARIDKIRYLSDPSDMWFADKVTVVSRKPREEIGQLLDQN